MLHLELEPAQHIRIAVERLHIARLGDDGVGGDESPQHRVVEAGVHVHQPQLVFHLVAGVAACRVGRGGEGGGIDEEAVRSGK